MAHEVLNIQNPVVLFFFSIIIIIILTFRTGMFVFPWNDSEQMQQLFVRRAIHAAPLNLYSGGVPPQSLRLMKVIVRKEHSASPFLRYLRTL